MPHRRSYSWRRAGSLYGPWYTWKIHPVGALVGVQKQVYLDETHFLGKFIRMPTVSIDIAKRSRSSAVAEQVYEFVDSFGITSMETRKWCQCKVRDTEQMPISYSQNWYMLVIFRAELSLGHLDLPYSHPACESGGFAYESGSRMGIWSDLGRKIRAVREWYICKTSVLEVMQALTNCIVEHPVQIALIRL